MEIFLYKILSKNVTIGDRSYTAEAEFKVGAQPRIDLNFCYSHSCLINAEIIGVYSHMQYWISNLEFLAYMTSTLPTELNAQVKFYMKSFPCKKKMDI